jgi:hypothetical protein
MKAAIFSNKASAMVRVSGAGTGTGFLIHRNLLLTTHANFPSVAAAESSEIWLHNSVSASLVPHRYWLMGSACFLRKCSICRVCLVTFFGYFFFLGDKLWLKMKEGFHFVLGSLLNSLKEKPSSEQSSYQL